jgi:methionine-gamma-lyase
VAPDARPGAGIVRLSIGLESGADLWRDLEAALDAAVLDPSMAAQASAT